MKFEKTLVWANCWLFAAFGLGFMFLPESLATLITGAAPATPSAMTDMRATYGGMALGLAVIFGLCARKEGHLRLGVQGVLAVMVALAGARLFGMLLDGRPNVFVFTLLLTEGAMALLAFSALRRIAS